MDISGTLAPNSDQLDAIELVAGPRIFTVDRVTKGNDEQPVQVHFTDFPRPWRPAKGMRRVLAACWGTDSSKWAGRRVELFFDPEVTFGKDKPGGTRISRMSHIDKAQSIPLLISRGKSATYKVAPLPDEPTPQQPPEPTEAEVAVCADVEELKVMWRTSGPELRAQIEQRVADLNNEPDRDDALPVQGEITEPQA